MSEIFSSAERAATDFDGWHQSLPEGIRKDVDFQLSLALDKNQEKQRIANSLWLASRTGLDLGTVADNYEKVRDGWAVNQGLPIEAYASDELFSGVVRSRAAQDAAERSLLFGAESDDDAGRQSRAESLATNARRQALWSPTMDPELRPDSGMWLKAKSGANGFRSDRAGYYEGLFSDLQAKERARFAPVMPALDEAWNMLVAVPKGEEVRPGDIWAVARNLAALPEDQASLVLAGLKERGEMLPDGDRAGFFERLGQSLTRGLYNFASDVLPETGNIITANVEDRLTGAVALFSDEAGQDLADSAAQRRREVRIANRLGALREEKIDPIRTDSTTDQVAMGIANTVPALAGGFMSGGAAWLNQGISQANEELTDAFQNAGVDARQSDRLAANLSPYAGSLMWAAEYFTFGMARGPAATIQRKLIGSIARSRPVTRWAAGIVGETAEQFTQEVIQDSTPVIVSELARMVGAPVPEQDVLDRIAKAANPETLGVSIVFALGGGGMMPRVEQARALKSLGFSDAAVDAVISAPDEQARATAFRSAILATELDAATLPADSAIPAESQADIDFENATAGVQSISRGRDGWTVTMRSGERAAVDSGAAAVVLRDQLAQTQSNAEAEAMVEIADHLAALDPRTEAEFTGKKVEFVGNEIFETIGRGAPRLRPLDAGTQAELDAEIEILRQSEGGEAAMRGLVEGSNIVSWKEVVGQEVEKIIMRQNVGGTVMTQFHEFVEGRWKAGMATGGINMAETFRALRLFEQATGQSLLGADPSEAEVREAVSNTASAYVFARRKDGKHSPAGAVHKGVKAAIAAATTKEDRAAVGKFRAFLRAAKQFWHHVFRTAAAIRSAMRKGKLKEGDDFTAFMDKLLGQDGQRAHEAAVAKAVDPVAGESAGRETMALSSATGLERLARQIENQQATPREKARIFNRMANELAGMARSVQFSDNVAEILKAGEIHEKAKVLRVKLAEQYENEAIEQGVGDILSAADLAKVRGQPFLAWLTDDSKGNLLKSKLMSRSRAMREGRYDPDVHGDFDGATGLPRWVFTGNQMPDQVAQAAYEDGILPDASVDTLWQRIGEELDAVSKWRTRVRDAQTKLMAAKARAANEARAWEMAEVAKMRETRAAVKDSDSKRALVILDKMLASLPAEVRAKVGGFTRVAELPSNEARFKYFASKVQEIDRVLETHLRNQYLEELRTLFRESAPRMAAGEKDKGKLGVDAHAWLQEAERISRLSAFDLEGEEAKVEKLLNGDEISQDAIRHYGRLFTFATDEIGARQAIEQHEALLNLFGALYHRRDGGVDTKGHMIPGAPLRNAGEIFAALEAAQGVVETGRLDWFQTIIARREERAARRDAAISNVGGAGTLAGAEAQSEDQKGPRQRLRNWEENHYSFEGFASAVFGQNSETHQWADQQSLRSDLQYRDAMRAREQALTAFLRSLWPRSSVRQRQKYIEKLATSKVVPGAPDGTPKMSELDAVHFSMLWADEDLESRAWLTEHGLGQDVQTAIEAWLSDEAKAIRQWLQAGYDAQYDQINSVFRRQYGVNMPRVKNYAPRLVDHGGNASEMQLDPLQEGRQLMAGFTKRRRVSIKSPPRQVDALSAYWQNAHAVEYWMAWAETTSDFRAVFSHYSTHAAVKSQWGATTAANLNKWLGALERNGMDNADGQWLLRRWASAQAVSALIGKVGVLAKQIVASYASASQVGIPEYFGAVRRIATGQSAISLREAYDMAAVNRRRDVDSPEVRVATRGRGLTPVEAVLDRFLKLVGSDINALDNAHVWLGNRIRWMDAVATTLSAAAAYDVAYQEGKAAGLNEADARGLAERRMEKVVADSAQPEAVRDKSLGELQAGVYGRLLMPFQSANRQALAMTFLALRQARYKDAARMALIHWVVTGVLAQTIGNLVRSALSGDDVEDVWEWEDYARAVAIGPLTGARYLGMGIEAVAPLIGGFERRTAAVPLSEGVRLLRLAFKGEWDFKSMTDSMSGVGLLLGGRASWAAIVANVLKQGAGVADTLTWSEQEAADKEAKANRAVVREAEKAKEKAEKEKMTDEQRAAAEARKQARQAKRRRDDARKAAEIRASEGQE